jgi:hypothetical protein
VEILKSVESDMPTALLCANLATFEGVKRTTVEYKENVVDQLVIGILK